MNSTETTTPSLVAIPTAPSEKCTKWQQYYNIVKELAIVDFRKKYHDSTLGYFWSMLNPLLRFAVYLWLQAGRSVLPKFSSVRRMFSLLSKKNPALLASRIINAIEYRKQHHGLQKERIHLDLSWRSYAAKFEELYSETSEKLLPNR